VNAPEPGRGLFASLRRLLATSLELAQVRLELVLTELEQEKLRLFDALLLAAGALVAFGIGLVLLVAFVVLLFPEPQRVAVVGVLALLLFAGSAWALVAARRRLRAPGGLFEASRRELARDRADLAGGE
jgi:uncharacterized membrane protein YqjE